MTGPASEREQALSALVSLSEQMLERATRGEWDEVPAMETQRQKRLAAFFSQPPAAEEIAFVKTGLERILELDQALLALGTQARDEAAGKLKQLHQGRRAQTAYDSNR